MKLKYITFIFENCDSITINGKYIGCFLVDDLHTKFERIACNAIDKIEVADTFAIEICKDANKERYAFEQTQFDDFKEMTFERLNKYHDITAIEFELEKEIWNTQEEISRLEKETFCYWINWTGHSEYVNDAQTNYVSNCGNLYIVISKDKKFEDFFEYEEINDEEATNFSFEMCDIGDKYNNVDNKELN